MTFGEVCAGVGGMSQGLIGAGLECKWLIEIDPAAAGVLSLHHPGVPIYADVKRFYPNRAEHAVDLIAGGTPCTDLSVAGCRAGLDGERSGLFFQMVRICRKLRPQFVLWENVLGACSSCEGRDLADVIGAFTGQTPAVPPDGWGSQLIAFFPAIAPCRWHVCLRVLDSQWFSVAQRRERIFLVASLASAGASAIEVLLEPESLLGNPPACGGARQAVAGTLAKCARAGGDLGTDFDLAGGLQASTGGADENDAKDGRLISIVGGGAIIAK